MIHAMFYAQKTVSNWHAPYTDPGIFLVFKFGWAHSVDQEGGIIEIIFVFIYYLGQWLLCVLCLHYPIVSLLDLASQLHKGLGFKPQCCTFWLYDLGLVTLQKILSYKTCHLQDDEMIRTLRTTRLIMLGAQSERQGPVVCLCSGGCLAGSLSAFL